MDKAAVTSLAKAITDSFCSPNVLDDNFENANLVDVINRLARSIYRLANVLEQTHLGFPKKPD